MSWIEKMHPEDRTAMKSWLWALHKKDANAAPVWVFTVPLLFTPLTVYLFLLMNDQNQAPSLMGLLGDWALYTVVSLAVGLIALPVTPLIKRYVYGSDKNNKMPVIGIWHEHLVKSLSMTCLHIVSSGLTAVLFMGWSGRGWALDPVTVWRWTWTLSLAAAPALLPGLVMIVAKIKLVTLSRARKRLEQG